MTFKLGKGAVAHDSRTYKLGRVLAVRLPDVPASKDWSAGTSYRMWGNDRYGCCAFASYAAAIATWTRAAQAEITLSTETVLAAYSEVTGFNPQAGYDPGTILLDQLNHWRREGLPRPGQPGRDYLTAFGSIAPTDVQGIKRGICYLGGVLAGVQVPGGFMNLGLGETWDLSKLSGADLAPEGGHAIALTGYTAAGVFFNTWGTRTFMPWTTFTQIADEAYGLLSRQNWLSIPGTSPNGEDFDALLTEVRGA